MLATSWTFNIRTVQQFYIHAVLSRFQSCLTLCNPMDCSLPSSSIHGTLQASIQEWVAMPSSRGSSQTMDWICISYISCSLPLTPPGKPFIFISSVQFSSVAQLCLTLCNPMNRSMPGLPVHHQFPEFTQTHVHRVSDAIQPSHPLSSPSPPAHNPSQHQGLFQWVNPSHEVAKVLVFQLQHQSFQWTPRTDLFQDGLVGSPCNTRDSQESSPTPQFKSINFSVLSFLHSPTLTSIHDH